MIREFLAVAARAALQWALASLLLANGAAFCLIAAAAARLRLGPPCILCARVHRLLCSASPASADGERDALRGLLCDAHLAAVAAACPATADRGDGVDGAPESKDDGLQQDDSEKVSGATLQVELSQCNFFFGKENTEETRYPGMETHRVVSIGSEICEQDHDGEQPGATDLGDVARTSSANDGDGQFVSLFELAPIIGHPGGGGNDSVDQATAPEVLTGDGDERLTIGQLVSALRAQRHELDALRAELAGERRARAEAEEYQRQLEEQGELDREAARLAMQLVHETETEKYGLQRQLDACRVRAQLVESESTAMVDAGGEANGSGDGNNYQSLVDFLPGSVYSSSPDLANLLKLYTETGNGGGGGGGSNRRRMYGYEASTVAVVAEETEEEEVAGTVAAGIESTSKSVDATTAIVSDSLHERSTTFQAETVTEAA
ncbi:hypothetical protein ACP70R_032706 [Stipagrostis hirtigluma subsp. patula]